MEKYTPKQIAIIESLAIYKFLTYKQMIDLSIGKYRSNMAKLLKDMLDRPRPLIGRIDMGVVPHKGRLPGVYYLTRWGVKALAEYLNYNLSEIQYPKSRAVFFGNDYFHRVATIDFYISLNRWADENEIDVELAEFYFNVSGANRGARQPLKANTRIDITDKTFLVPDAVFIINGTSKRQLILLEVHNGKDTKKLLRQLAKHQEAMAKGSANDRFDFRKGYRVALVFEHSSILQRTLARLNELESIQNFKKVFVFNTIEQVKNNINAGWVDAGGEQWAIS